MLAAPLPENMERELVIVDDCSTDGTSEILDAWPQASRASACSASRESGQRRGGAHRDSKRAPAIFAWCRTPISNTIPPNT